MKIIEDMANCKRVERGKYAHEYGEICDKKAVFVAGKPETLRNVFRQWAKRTGNELIMNTVIVDGELGIVVRLASVPEPTGREYTMEEIINMGKPQS